MADVSDAIKAGDAARVAALIDADPSLAKTPVGNITPLLLALYHGQAEIARLIADRAAPLSFAEACALGDADAARRMLDARAAVVDEPTADGFPPLGLAIFFRQPEVARLLIERGADVNAAAANPQRVAPLHAAAAVEDVETTRALLERGADPNARQQMEYTPLHGAASRGNVEIGTLLLERGADRDARGSDGLTPADIARKYGKPEFAEWIERV